ncbi:hypothetical protein A0H81_14960 [Grifola frondosa]|uniref:Uncharacterized protein n=1 Tax=Grifola frondosa TaxID=5627 RepID=A0A1C7LLI2_GRIFR|nr:hypothetical protein A0H81_14960 [Grifola frondosa]
MHAAAAPAPVLSCFSAQCHRAPSAISATYHPGQINLLQCRAPPSPGPGRPTSLPPYLHHPLMSRPTSPVSPAHALQTKSPVVFPTSSDVFSLLRAFFAPAPNPSAFAPSLLPNLSRSDIATRLRALLPSVLRVARISFSHADLRLLPHVVDTTSLPSLVSSAASLTCILHLSHPARLHGYIVLDRFPSPHRLHALAAFQLLRNVCDPLFKPRPRVQNGNMFSPPQALLLNPFSDDLL